MRSRPTSGHLQLEIRKGERHPAAGRAADLPDADPRVRISVGISGRLDHSVGTVQIASAAFDARVESHPEALAIVDAIPRLENHVHLVGVRADDARKGRPASREQNFVCRNKTKMNLSIPRDIRRALTRRVAFADLDVVDGGAVGGIGEIQIGEEQVEVVAGRSADSPDAPRVGLVRRRIVGRQEGPSGGDDGPSAPGDG